MADQQPSFFDTFAGREAERMETIMAELDGVPWAQGILRSVQQNGGLVGKNMANFFELRYGHALHKAGIAVEHEVSGAADGSPAHGSPPMASLTPGTARKNFLKTQNQNVNRPDLLSSKPATRR
jgi:hypothetical protein